MLIGYIVSNKITISLNDLVLAFLAGSFQIGLGFIFITIGAKKTLSAMVGIIMLTEAVLGPFWAWLFINENPPSAVIIGGAIVIIAVLVQFLSILKTNMKL